jgi:L-fucose isomerase-like protein
MGTNCLNESHFSDTTPCLAWCLLYEELGIQWACEADTVSLTTQFLLGRSLNTPVIMSNVYPFLVGNAALKHERIKAFPAVDEPENHLLIVHCGYFGLAPQSCTSQWALKPKVLSIVNDNATAVDARLPEGKVTLVKVDPTFNKLMVIAGAIVDYVQYPGSDCRNGAVIRIKDGHKLMKSFYSHHYGIIVGNRIHEIDFVARTFGLVLEEY